MSRDHVVYLRITSMRGSLDGEHYYAELVYSGEKYERIDLEHRISSAQAKRMNKKDDWKFHKAGQTSGRFETKDEAIKTAIAEYKKRFPKAVILLLGDAATAEVKRVLDAPSKELQEQCNALFDEHEKIGWVQRGGFLYRTKGGEAKAWELYKRWNKIITDAVTNL
jgi:exoribonuclease R